MKDRVDSLINRQIVHIPINNLVLEGELVIPPQAKGLVIFAHGSGSSRHSPRNKFVADRLHRSSLATLLVDLLSEEEDLDFQTRFDINLLTERLVAITDWAAHYSLTNNLVLGYFGASTGATAAVMAAIGAEDTVKAVVSRGGRVDLAHEAIEMLKVPTLLIIGQEDHAVLEANKAVFRKLTCPKQLATIPGASHLFEEPGALDQVAELATTWFSDKLESSNAGKTKA